MRSTKHNPSRAIPDFRAIAARALAELTPRSETARPTEWEGRELCLEEFPIPDLVLFALTNLRGLKAVGPGEKIAWSIDARFRDVPIEISLRKFGFRVIYPKGVSATVVDALVKYLRKAAELAARSLEDFGDQQIEQGNISIDNRYRVFDGAYRFFRREAEERFSDSPDDGFGALLSGRFAEAGYCAGAMVNAYFSRLEHVLLLAIAFTDFAPGGGALRKFAEQTWDQKLAQVFDLEKDGVAKAIRDLLGKIKKQFRNPISHGGIDKKGTVFHFNVPGIGHVPALLQDYRVAVERLVTPITKAEFRALCTELDECDAMLETTHLAAGIRFAQRCLPVSFADAKRSQYRAVAANLERFEEFFDQEVEIMDMHANMDY